MQLGFLIGLSVITAWFPVLMNRDYNKLSIYINYNIYMSKRLEEYKEKVDAVLKDTFKGMPVYFKTKDFLESYAYIVSNLIILQIASILTVYIICFLVVGFMYKSFIAGLLSVVPNILPIFYTFKCKYLKLHDKCLASKKTLKSQVISITIASASIAISCLMLLNSQFLPVTQLVFLSAMGICFTWLASLVITPFLLRKINIWK